VETDRSGRIEVDRHLRLPGDERVFVIGDVAAHANPDGTPTPGLAPAAKQQGRYAARTLAAACADRQPPGPFRYRDYGQLATIGRHSAVVNLRGWRISGYLAWWFWGLAHIYYLIGFRNRIVVAANWFWSYLTFGRGIRLITGDVQEAQQGQGDQSSRARY
jgi:NADH dehydrogenase FAD-containing subunit